MPDAGDPILVEDFTASSQDVQAGDINNISDTSFVAGSTPCSRTFVAPTSGAALIILTMQANADSSTNRIDLSYELRETNASGTIIVAASAARCARMVLSSTVSTLDQSNTYVDYVTGLTAGQTYYVQTMHQVSGGSDLDLTSRELAVVPLPA